VRIVLAGIVAAVGFASPSLALQPGFSPIAVRGIPIESFRAGSSETMFGDLEFLGGLVLSSQDQPFGGFSGVDFLADGTTLVATSDRGNWFTARLIEQDGRLTGIADAGIAPMLMDDGKPPATKIDGDAEGLRFQIRDGAPVALVSFEQDPAIREYAGPHFATSTPRRLPLPGFVDGLPPNQGLETVAIAPEQGPLAGAVVTIAEQALDGDGHHRGFVLDGPKAGEFSIKRSGDFDVTDAAFMPDGDLLVLERRFSYVTGPGMRLRVIPADVIRPGATVEGHVLLEADGRNSIDNMEGLAMTVRDGRPIFTLISDDNTSPLQRTMLLRFALVDE
jgi:hypothetical protein